MVDCKVGFRTGVILEGADAIVVTAKVQSTTILLHTEGTEGKGCAFFGWLYLLECKLVLWAMSLLSY